MKNYYIDLGSSTIKTYCFQKGFRDYKSYFLNHMIFEQSEQTSVTKMERRVFDLDIMKLKQIVKSTLHLICI